jgi:hypothetical protein
MQSPHELAEIRMRKCAEYDTLSEELIGLENQLAVKWLEIRDDLTSDTKADRHIAASEMGQRAHAIRRKLKALEKVISSIRSYLEVLQGEARNLY